MRTHHRAFAEHRPIRRNIDEKRRQLNDLCTTMLRLRANTTPALRQSIERRIQELRAELRQRSAEAAPTRGIHHRSYVLHAD